MGEEVSLGYVQPEMLVRLRGCKVQQRSPPKHSLITHILHALPRHTPTTHTVPQFNISAFPTEKRIIAVRKVKIHEIIYTNCET